ncbi:unnamed protein product, partial [Choristocarpus tenellus]
AVTGGGGGSRAAKKRRKQKQNGQKNGQYKGIIQIFANGNDKGKSKAKDSSASTDMGKLVKRSGTEGDKGKGKSIAVGGNIAVDNDAPQTKRKRDGGESMQGCNLLGSGSKGSSVPQAIIDASDVDDRSRLLLALDAHEVIADPDVESGLKARQLLQWMVAPLSVEEFYASYWEQNAFVVRGRDPSYFAGWFHKIDMESFVSGQAMQYGVDLDVTNYIGKKRVTLNPAGPGAGLELGGGGGGGGAAGGGSTEAVSPAFVWDSFKKGCSLRMPCPQTFSDPLHKLLSGLEEEFGCMVGSNVYLTPPGAQGFAPHWDDIEAFLMQVEGTKRWRVYRPKDVDASLPRYSSANLTDTDVGEEPFLDVLLGPGDLLYFPRGWAHQAETVGGEASLHITVSAMQGNCWSDFIETLMPQALASASLQNLSLRQGLPRDYLDYMGIAHCDEV